MIKKLQVVFWLIKSLLKNFEFTLCGFCDIFPTHVISKVPKDFEKEPFNKTYSLSIATSEINLSSLGKRYLNSIEWKMQLLNHGIHILQ